jgi:Na+-translocating ferredoxin:NAD+ oxidoreductase RNF subunit RnfB
MSSFQITTTQPAPITSELPMDAPFHFTIANMDESCASCLYPLKQCSVVCSVLQTEDQQDQKQKSNDKKNIKEKKCKNNKIIFDLNLNK